jgi:hypothetical protein
MDSKVTRESIEVPVACNWSALTAVQQEWQRALYRQLRGREGGCGAGRWIRLQALRRQSGAAECGGVRRQRAPVLPVLRVRDHSRTRWGGGVAGHDGRGRGQARPRGRDGRRCLRIRLSPQWSVYYQGPHRPIHRLSAPGGCGWVGSFGRAGTGSYDANRGTG